MVGEIGSKAISAFNSVEVEVEAELGKRKKNIEKITGKKLIIFREGIIKFL